MKSLSYITWVITLAFVCLQLPYPLLLALFAFILVGIVTYLRRGAEPSTQYALPAISRLARMVVQNMGSAQRGRDSFSGGSMRRILSPRSQSIATHDRHFEPTNPLSPDSMDSSSSFPAAESSRFAERQKLQRSWSEGSGHSVAARPTGFAQSRSSFQVAFYQITK